MRGIPSPPAIFCKAQAKGDTRTGDLFSELVDVGGYVTPHGTYVAPHQARRTKRHAILPSAQQSASPQAEASAEPPFHPTHTTIDGEPVRPYAEDGRPQPGVWEDQHGNIIEDDYAAPIEAGKRAPAQAEGGARVGAGETAAGMGEAASGGDAAPAVVGGEVGSGDAAGAPADVEGGGASVDAEPELDDATRRRIADRVAQAAKLRENGDKTVAQAEEVIGRDRLVNTARRARMAAGAVQDAERRRAIGVTMRNLADAIEAGDAPHLAGLSTRTQVETLEGLLRSAMGKRERTLSWGEQERLQGRAPEPADVQVAEMPTLSLLPRMALDYARDLERSKGGAQLGRDLRVQATARLRDDSLVYLDESDARRMVDVLRASPSALPPWHLDSSLTALSRLRKIGVTDNLSLRQALTEYAMFRSGARKLDPVQEAERALIGTKIPGYFPTPPAVAERMIDAAGIQPGMRVLEPSAGKGSIADAVRSAGVAPEVMEVSGTLREILEAKGYSPVATDFMAVEARPAYDAVVMNPPFDHGQDMEHVRHAWDFVRPGGVLVSIMSEGPFFRDDRKAREFREWLEKVGGQAEKLPERSFMESERQTGVSTRIVTIRKPPAASPEERAAVEREHAEDRYDLAEALRHSPEEPATAALLHRVSETERQLAEGPQEGDTKTDEGVTYVLRDGRWHRHAPEERAEVAELGAGRAAERLSALAAKIEQMGGRAEIAQALKQASKSKAWRAKAEDLIAALTKATGASREEVLAELGIREHAKAKRARRGTPEASPEGDYSDLDPASPNYRYRDTGYIPGSRKEEAANLIKAAAAKGVQVTSAELDWEDLEKNPRQAKEVITKSNLFGSVDWEGLKAAAMDPGAGFVIDRVYAAVSPAPSEDSPQARQDYVLGLETLRTRLEACRTAEDVGRVLQDLRDEYEGALLNEAETAQYQELAGIRKQFFRREGELREQREALAAPWNAAQLEVAVTHAEIGRRERRGWQPDPALLSRLEDAQTQERTARGAMQAFADAHPEGKARSRDLGGGSTAYDSDLQWEARKASMAMEAIVAKAKLRNQTENPLHRAWTLMGDRFVGVLNYRSARWGNGSDAFAKHMAAAQAGQISDWSWLEKEAKRAPRASTESARFQLRVADTYERTGGRPVHADSTATLKAMFGLRDVQSGNWVLRDVNSAKFHVERSAEAFADLADLLGVPDDFVSMSGRLAMAFGARGRGAEGWADTATRAHYEAVHRVVNITKMGGGGSLAHEWFHVFDNLLKEAAGDGDAGAKDFVTARPDALSDPDLRSALHGLMDAIRQGELRVPHRLAYTARDYRTARSNLEAPRNTVGRGIRDAGNLQDALDFLDRHFMQRADRKSASLHQQWRTLAAAYYGGQQEGGDVVAQAGEPMSSFALEALRLDKGERGKSWSRPQEMAARAFQSWCEDRLAEQGRRNDYLSIYADNQYHVDPRTGIQWNPYPEGEERTRINAAFDRLFGVVRQKREMLKAFAGLPA